MKISNKIIIYDDGCPLCSAYTSVFVKTGILSKEGRKNFSNIEPAIFNLIDKNKCNKEIPLIDTDTNQVWYGIDALLELLNNKIPFIKFVGNIKPVKWLLQRLYYFISYNRKVIVAFPSKNGYDCSPDFNIKYRVYFLLFLLIFNTWLLLPLHTTILCKSYIANSSFAELQLAHIFFVALNLLMAVCLGKKKGLEYLGQINMLTLIFLLLLVPLAFINHISNISNETINNIYLGIASIFSIKEYIRRIRHSSVIPNYLWLTTVNIISFLAIVTYLVF
jgi:predicted DCC family thiol-disulfide oxidoreductase YuxK